MQACLGVREDVVVMDQEVMGYDWYVYFFFGDSNLLLTHALDQEVMGYDWQVGFCYLYWKLLFR